MARKNPSRKCNLGSVRSTLRKMNYGLVGETSAVQICRWTKNSLRGDRGCWKEKFYGISSAGCVQMTPSVMWCENSCLHCWRPIEMNLGTELPVVDSPTEILDGIIMKRREMLMGIKGNKKVDAKNFEEMISPKLFTMSLSGEATLYPRLGEMFSEIRRRGGVSFLVTNGLNPEALQKLEKDGLPTQLVISTNAPNEKLFLQWHRSTKVEAWNVFLKSLDVMRKLKGKVRRVIRLTLVKKGSDGEFCEMTNMSEENLDEYVSLIKRAEPDFVHVKGYKAVGFARKRMGYDKQVWHGEVLEFARKLLERLNCVGEARSCDREGSLRGNGKAHASHGGLAVEWELGAEDERSCVVALVRKGVGMRIERI